MPWETARLANQAGLVRSVVNWHRERRANLLLTKTGCALQSGALEQIVGRERNQRACHRQLVRNVVVSRRVNSIVMWLHDSLVMDFDSTIEEVIQC